MLIQCFQRPGSPTTLSMSGYEYKFIDNYKYGEVEIPAGSFVCNVQNREHAARLLSFDHFKEYKPVAVVVPLAPEVDDYFSGVRRIVAKTDVEEPIAVEQPKNKGGRPRKKATVQDLMDIVLPKGK